MTFGLSARLIVSHTLVAVAASVVFAAALLTTVGRQAMQAGVAVDYATAYRIAPALETYLTDGLDAALPPMMRPDGEAPRAMPRMVQPGTPVPPATPTLEPLPRTMGPWQRFRPMPVPVAMLIERPILLVDASGRVVWERGEVPDPLPRSFRPTAGVPITIPSNSGVLGENRRGMHHDRSSAIDTEERDLYLFVGGMIDPERNPLSQAFNASTTRATALTGIVLVLAAVVVSILWARVFLRPIRDVRDAATAIAGGDYARRVTLPSGRHELADLARDFNEMAGEVEAQEKSRRQFVGDAAHELRTPIALLTTRIEMLRRGIYATDETQWNALTTDLGRIGRLVDDLQTLARADAGKLTFSPSILSLTAAVDESCAAFRPVADKAGVALRTRHTAEGPLLFVDPTRFRQILANLLSNAVRYTSKGATVVVETGGDSENAWVAVEDAGPGIPLAERDRVFQRFVRLDPARDRGHGGSGLGLAIVAEFVRRQRGTIVITDPQVGATGTRFVVTFPTAGREAATSNSSIVELE